MIERLIIEAMRYSGTFLSVRVVRNSLAFMLLEIQFYLVVFAITALSYPIFVVTLCDALQS